MPIGLCPVEVEHIFCTIFGSISWKVWLSVEILVKGHPIRADGVYCTYDHSLQFITPYYTLLLVASRASSGSEGKASACKAGDLGSIPSQEDPLEKEMATHSSTLAWKIPWTEKPDRLQSMGSQRVGHDWATSLLYLARRSCEITHTVLKVLTIQRI